MRGKFITLEGLEAVGKTTNRELIEKLLEEAGIEYVGTREPGGTPIGEQLRDLVLHAHGSMCRETELLMMVASRVELIAQLIEPALARGQWVLCDRFMDASVAYQGAGRQLGVERVRKIHELVGVTLKPDLTLLLDMPIQDGLARMVARGKPDRIEREELAFFERARAAYLQQAELEPDRVRVIDAALSIEDVGTEVRQLIQQFIKSCV